MEYVAAAAIVNTVYGAATGESGGLIGEAFGVQDKIDEQQAQAKQDAANKMSALQAQQRDAADKAAAASASLSSQIAEQQQASTTVVAPAAAAPVVTPPTVMPSSKDTNVAAARKASIAAQRRRQGRASTILTGDLADTLG